MSAEKTGTELVPASVVPTTPAVKITKLTKAQLALIDVLQDPRVVELDVTQICKLANVTRATYYSAFKDKDFLAALESMVQETLVRNEPAVIHNVLAKAKDPKEKNQHWAQMVLKMRGRLEEKNAKPAQVIVNFGNVKRPTITVITPEQAIKAEADSSGED